MIIVTKHPIPTPINLLDDVLLNNFFKPVFANFSTLSDKILKAIKKAPKPPINCNTAVT